MPLREFLQAMAIAEHGRRKFQVHVPLAPLKLVVRIGENLRLPLPITSDNLKGMETVQVMDTASSLQAAGVRLTPFPSAMASSVKSGGLPEFPRMDLTRILMVGAGKIGIVHALNASRQEGVQLCAIVDRNPKAFALYRSMGFNIPFFTDLDQAVAQTKPHGAIIGTPASTHIALTKSLLSRGVPVLVEKPLGVSPKVLDEFEALSAQYPGIPSHTGYMAAQFPHLQKAKEILASGRIGTIRSVRAYALQSHIMGAKPVRWEMIKAQSGGGVLINFAGHVLSMLFRLFETPRNFEGAMWAIHSTQVEDAAVAALNYESFDAVFLTGWSLKGFPRPVNRIVIQGSEKELVIENFGTWLRQSESTTDIWTQRSFDLGYNAAPDYTGAGFSSEHKNFMSAVRTHHKLDEPRLPARPGREAASLPVGIDEAVRLERWIHQFYQNVSLDAPLSKSLEKTLAATPDDLALLNQLCEGRRS
jgi:predicted dehydrogenase